MICILFTNTVKHKFIYNGPATIDTLRLWYNPNFLGYVEYPTLEAANKDFDNVSWSRTRNCIVRKETEPQHKLSDCAHKAEIGWLSLDLTETEEQGKKRQKLWLTEQGKLHNFSVLEENGILYMVSQDSKSMFTAGMVWERYRNTCYSRSPLAA